MQRLTERYQPVIKRHKYDPQLVVQGRKLRPNKVTTGDRRCSGNAGQAGSLGQARRTAFLRPYLADPRSLVATKQGSQFCVPGPSETIGRS